MFHVTNTDAVITLSGVALHNADEENVLLSVCADGWSGGENIAILNASGQDLTGNVLVGDDSEFSLTLSDGSSLTGAFSGDIRNASGAVVSSKIGKVTVSLDGSSSWTLTSDCYISSFTGDPASVRANGHTLYVNGVALEGVSQ